MQMRTEHYTKEISDSNNTWTMETTDWVRVKLHTEEEIAWIM